MKSSLSIREQMLHKISDWSEACPDIRGLALIGSSARSARSDHPADQWSDIDLVMVSLNSDRYLRSDDWLTFISEPWITTVERDPFGNVVERRVLFRNGQDVDFIVVARDHLAMLAEEPFSGMIRRGFRILFDKDQLFPAVQIPVQKEHPSKPPSIEEFSELVNDFWFHAAWTAKKIRRSELWTARSCCDVYMKKLLLTMIEWHTHSFEGWEQETWYNGRFIETWAKEPVVGRLGDIFAHYDEADIARALLSTMELFDRIGKETARELKYPYPEAEAQGITQWLLTSRDQNPFGLGLAEELGPV